MPTAANCAGVWSTRSTSTPWTCRASASWASLQLFRPFTAPRTVRGFLRGSATSARKATSQPWRDLFNTGAVITNGTDVPVERISPIASYYSSVSRMMVNGERFYPEHAMTREEAMQHVHH